MAQPDSTVAAGELASLVEQQISQDWCQLRFLLDTAAVKWQQ